MADSFFRPGFTQGVWAEGELFEHLYYEAYVGNSLNTLGISTSRIDRNMAYSTSMWWEPLGDYAPPGAARTAFSDSEYHECPVVRLGNILYGGAGGPALTPTPCPIPKTSRCTTRTAYSSSPRGPWPLGSRSIGKLLHVGTGLRFQYRGFALNAQYFLRWLNNFAANRPLPLDSEFDQDTKPARATF